MNITLEEVCKLLHSCSAIIIDGVATSKYKLLLPGIIGEDAVFFTIEWCDQQQKHFEVQFKQDANAEALLDGATLRLKDIDGDEWFMWLLFPGTTELIKRILSV